MGTYFLGGCSSEVTMVSRRSVEGLGDPRARLGSCGEEEEVLWRTGG